MSELLPPQSTTAERALSDAIARISDVPVPIDTLWTPETCPAGLLPWLAWAVSVDVWDSRWPDQVKRDVIAASIALHREKGTKAGMLRALAALGVEADIDEWFDVGGQPYTFRVRARPTIDLIGDPTLPFLSVELQEQIERVVAVVKPVRSHADLFLVMSITSEIQIGAVAHIISTNQVTTEATRILHGGWTAAALAQIVQTVSVATAASRTLRAPVRAACVALISSTVTLEAL